jgi:K+-sensing histidine kinase KdpD
MSNRKDDVGAYVRRVNEETRDYLLELVTENERIRAVVTTLEEDRLRAARERERLRSELDAERLIRQHLEADVGALAGESKGHQERYREIERQNSNLANLFVAAFRLHATLDRGEVLAVIQEIIINLVGSEEIAILEVADGDALVLGASFGIDTTRWQRVPLHAGRIGRTVAAGAPWTREGPAAQGAGDPDDGLTACIPLSFAGRVIGAIAVFRLLPHKTHLEEVDHEIFGLLATHAALALYSAGLHAKEAR